MSSKTKLKSKSTLFDIQKNERWYIDDVVRETKRAPKTIRNLCCLGKIPHMKERNRLVFIPQEIRKWMEPTPRRINEAG
jgi:hypothetical protein